MTGAKVQDEMRAHDRKRATRVHTRTVLSKSPSPLDAGATKVQTHLLMGNTRGHRSSAAGTTAAPTCHNMLNGHEHPRIGARALQARDRARFTPIHILPYMDARHKSRAFAPKQR